MAKRYSVRLYISKRGKGRVVGGSYNPETGAHRRIYSSLKQITYNADTIYEALDSGFGYVGGQKHNIITSYTVTDRKTGEKYNIKLT